jgi:ABC-type transport system substrate-binding protein
MFNLKSSSKLSATLLALILGASVFMAGSVSAQKYGGSLTVAAGDKRMGFDPVAHWSDSPGTVPGHDNLLQVDMKRGPGGTGEFPFNMYGTAFDSMTGAVAESYEVHPTKIIFKLRRGVHFRNKPPVNGRELDAHDVIASWKAAIEISNTQMAGKKDAWTWTALDQWTVELKWEDPVVILETMMAPMTQWGVFPRELVEQGINRKDWRNTYGTGAFYPTDFVDGSQVVYEKNPNYWEKDPLHPENQLPYVDKIKYIILEETAKIAGLRTGKIDLNLWGLAARHKESLVKSNPEIEVVGMLDKAMLLTARITMKPFSDKRVRKAVMLAINHQEMKDQLYQGDAVYPTFPVHAGFTPYHISLEEMYRDRPDIARLFEYHPEEAKQLLAEAGYPNGFKTNIITSEIMTEGVEAASLYLSLVGIDAQVRNVEVAKMYSMTMTKEPDPTYTGLGSSDTGCQVAFPTCAFQIHMDPRGPMTWFGNGNTEFENSELGQTFIKMFDDLNATMDPDEHLRKWKKLTYWAYDELWFMPMVMKMGHNYHQPWVHGFDGVHGLMDKWLYHLKGTWLDLDQRQKKSGRGPND